MQIYEELIERIKFEIASNVNQLQSNKQEDSFNSNKIINIFVLHKTLIYYNNLILLAVIFCIVFFILCLLEDYQLTPTTISINISTFVSVLFVIFNLFVFIFSHCLAKNIFAN